MAADFIKINGTLYNTSDVKRINPGDDGTVKVSFDRMHLVFTVEEGTEHAWAYDLASQMGKVIDTSRTSVERA